MVTTASDFFDDNAVGGVIPPGSYEFDDQFVLDRPLVGSGPVSADDGTRFIYSGPDQEDGFIKFPTGSWGRSLKDIAIEGPASGVGVGIGCDTTTIPNGSQAGGCRFENVWLSGWDIGVKVGDDEGRAASEITFANCRVIDSRIGWELRAWNTLNVRFEMLQVAHVTVGVDCYEAQSVFIHGGSASHVGTVMIVRAGGCFGLHDLRQEDDADETAETRLLTALAPTAAQQVKVSGCHKVGGPLDAPEIYSRWGAGLRVSDCVLRGHIQYASADRPPPDPGFGTVLIENCKTKGPRLHSINGRTAYRVVCCSLVDEDGVTTERLNEYRAGRGD